ncbi:hypothetical protein [Polyangium mundeleinium]|uniref:Lipoprotein n=1 Tax=Polyangium mundeleinium TaxID=2995306 RepID=A0ABT5EJK7_9BACT|nr:hypothetical protein [Polyangium mundeleinium]MDC0741966.1 hypothetical protein [Polyangium mundeleinium]
MRTNPLSRALAISFSFALAALLGIGCSCEENEFDGATACQKLVDAANGVLQTCNKPAVDANDVCLASTDDCSSISGCSAKVDVDACVKLIQARDCGSVELREYAWGTVCTDVLANIKTSCDRTRTGSGDSDDD